MTTSPTSLRCDSCGSSLSTTDASCPSCGRATAFPGASAGAFGSRPFESRPLPPGPYNVDFGPVESLVATLELWRENLGAVSLFAAIPYLLLFSVAFVGAGAAVFAAPTMGNEWDWTVLAPIVSAAIALFAVVAVASCGAIIHTVDERARGTPASIGTSLLFGLKTTLRLLVGGVVLWVLFVAGWSAVGAPLLFAFMPAADFSGAWLALPGLGVAFLTTWLVARLTPVFPAMIAEDLGIFAAMGRAWSLTRGHALSIVGSALLFWMMSFVASFVLAVFAIIPFVGLGVQLVAQVAMMSVACIFPFAIYAGLVRREQIERAADQAGRGSR
jgi:hypothetical protein